MSIFIVRLPRKKLKLRRARRHSKSADSSPPQSAAGKVPEIRY